MVVGNHKSEGSKLKLKEVRARGPEGYRNYSVFEITYAKGDVVERFHPGTQYQHKKGYFRAKESIFGTGDILLTCIKPISWKFTIEPCPECFDRMCAHHIENGYCRKYR